MLSGISYHKIDVMGILEKLGLAQKKREAAPTIGANKIKEQEEVAEKRSKYYRAAIFITFLLIILITLPRSTFQPVSSYNVGEPWRADDLTAPFTFALQKTSEELQQERQEIRDETFPVFHVNHNAGNEIESNLDSLVREIQPVLDSYAQWQRASRNGNETAPEDSLQFVQDQQLADVELDSSAWELLLENYATVILNNQPENRSILFQIRTQLDGITNNLLSTGIIDRDIDDIEQDEIRVRNLELRTERTVSTGNLNDLPEALNEAEQRLNNIFRSEIADIAMQLFEQVITPNWIYSEEDTNAMIEEELENISTTKGAVDQGQIIIRRGDIVTPEKANILRSLAEARAATATQLETWLRYSGEAIVIVIAALMFFFYLFLYRRSIYDKPSMFLLVFLVLSLVTLASSLTYPFEVNSYIIPIAVAPIILTIIFDSRVGLMATVTLAIITGLIQDNSFEYLVATTAACSLGVFSVRDIKKRSQFFFTTPGIVFFTYFLVVGGFALARYSGWEGFLNNTVFIAINAVFILFTYPLILLFEKLFKITTDFTLLELADTNLPLMKELMGTAPGTFHHSLQVANMAESAASEIGANALLCRVGAMFHDIGKMEKPNYFIENQSKSNEHDKLKPRMSALVIKAHVTNGVKKADEHDLPDVIIDFIKTHHGTSLIKYFYQKAKEGPEEIQEEDFRYEGPTPFTKEQGILMLADSIEAASRSMKDPNYNKLYNLIEKVVENHISDGQLSNCPLTFRQIQIIKETFLSILVGVYHSRVEYPEDEDSKKDKPEENTSEKKKVEPEKPNTDNE